MFLIILASLFIYIIKNYELREDSPWIDNLP